ncbi:MAG: hypothetical protein A2026_09090 [Deltaproteobacteria bacterium RBG_19FT_COMBO_46_12]|nr:MAG: hypothetical protein A2026_09090 [Deltaproteobacteria bacterium RBG_19FT_COMBO_46_12]
MIERLKLERKRIGIWISFFLIFFEILALPIISKSQELNSEGWAIPDLKGLIPYSMQVKQVDGVEKIVEKFYTPDGGHVARVSGNSKIFAYAVDSDKEPPIDYLLVDPDGSGIFSQKFRSEDSYKIPDWVSR